MSCSGLNILNILHSPGWGGAETSFAGITRVMSLCNNRVVCVVPKKSKITKVLKDIVGEDVIEYNRVYKNWGKFDIFIKYKLAKIIKKHNIDIVIVHNGRLIDIIKSSSIKTPLVAVNHGTNPKKTAKADYAFVVNSKMYKEILLTGMKKDSVFLIPNYIDINEK